MRLAGPAATGEARAEVGRPGRPLPLLPIAVIASAIVYYPITANYFVYDDFLHLYQIANDSVWSWLFQVHGGHLYVVRNLIFYLCHALFGTEPAYYFWLVLLTHLVNVALLYAVVARLTRSAPLACFAAVLWGTCPVNEGALGWYSVYGQVLVATIVLWILHQVSAASVDGVEPGRATLAGWYALLLVACTCFGTGIGVALVFPLALFLLLPPGPRRTPVVLVFASLPLVVLALYAALVYVAPRSGETDLIRYLIAGLKYWNLIGTFLMHLFGYGLASLLLGFAFRPAAYPELFPFVTAGFVALVALAAFVGRRDGTARRLLAFAVVALGCYAIVAAGRGFFYPNATAAMIGARQTRYHYVGPIPLTIMLSLALARLAEWRPIPAPYRGTLLAAWLGLTAFFYVRFATPINHFDDSREETQQTIAAIRAAIAAAPGGEVRLPNRPFHHIGVLNDRRDFPAQAAIFVIFFPSDVVDGKRVYFVESDAKVVAAAKPGSRIASLLVPPAAG